MTIDLAEVLYRLGFLDVEQVSAVATQSLVDGFDGPALRELAWSHSSWDEVGTLFEQALHEMGRTPLSEPEAVVTIWLELACHVARGGTPWNAAKLERVPFWDWHSSLQSSPLPETLGSFRDRLAEYYTAEEIGIVLPEGRLDEAWQALVAAAKAACNMSAT